MKQLPLLCVVLSATAFATDTSGYWRGEIETPNGSLPIMVNLQGSADSLMGAITIPSQGLRDFRLSELSVDGIDLQFSLNGLPGSPAFAGRLSQEGDIIRGTVTQNGYESSFILRRAKRVAAMTKADEFRLEDPIPGTDMVGEWRGILKAGQAQFRLILRIQSDGSEQLWGVLESLDQDARIPIDLLDRENERLTVGMSAIDATFAGALNEAGDALPGHWEQSGQRLPLTFFRMSVKPGIRGDHPVEPEE